jgi:hypothetical protein
VTVRKDRLRSFKRSSREAPRSMASPTVVALLYSSYRFHAFVPAFFWFS